MNLKLRHFKLIDYGYYSYKKKNKYEDIDSTLRHLQEWTNGSSVLETGIGQEDNCSTYLMDIKNDNEIWVITIWNKASGSSANEIISLDLNSKCGSASTENVSSKNGNLGYPTYFLINSKELYYSTITDESPQSVNRMAFEKYILSFMLIDPHYAKYDENDTINEDQSKTKTKGNLCLPNIQNTENMTPRFSGKLVKTPSEKEYVIKNFDKITAIENRCTLNISKSESSKNRLKQFTEKLFGRTEYFAPMDRIRINTSISAAFSTKDNLIEWIDDWEKASINEDYDDCGFKLRNDNKIYWINGNIVITKLDDNHIYKKNGTYPSSSLLKLISKNLTTINNAVSK